MEIPHRLASRLNIYNVNTGKLVVGGDLMNEEISYTDEDWEKTL